MVYVCYDNGAYMNTGTQRSSSTPHFADTTTSPAGKVTPGKAQKRKDLPVKSDYFIEKEITIGEEVIEGYYNETLKYDVVGLKDNTGNIKYYIYK